MSMMIALILERMPGYFQCSTAYETRVDMVDIVALAYVNSLHFDCVLYFL